MKTIMSMLLVLLALNANANTYAQEKPDVLDTFWDIANVLYDAGKIGYGYCTNNPAMVQSGLVDLSCDVTCMFIPGLPAGATKLPVYGVKQAVKVGSKQSARTYSKAAAKEFLQHILIRHTNTIESMAKHGGVGKFFASSTDEVASIMVKAKERIASGNAILQYSNEHKCYQYLIDMGEVVGKYKSGKNAAGYKYKDTKIVSLILNPKTTNGGSFTPVKPISLTQEGRGFTNYINW